eukprot:gene6524-6591_t
MKTILCFGDSNTFGSPGRPLDVNSYRHSYGTRWTSVASQLLGPKFNLIIEGLPGRTTVHDDPIEGAHKNGRRMLLGCLESQVPLDAVVIMLGTNDLKARFGLNPSDIAAGAGVLLRIIRDFSMDYGPIKTVLVCPPPILEIGALATMFEGGAAKSKQLAPAFRTVAQMHDAVFVDAGTIVQTSRGDGIHLDIEDHARFGRHMAQCLEGLWP